jgi:hypothetical protein
VFTYKYIKEQAEEVVANMIRVLEQQRLMKVKDGGNFQVICKLELLLRESSASHE